MKSIFERIKKEYSRIHLRSSFGTLELLKYIGPGLLVTVGFIDPGNWASNFAVGSQFGYTLLWVVTLSAAMLIIIAAKCGSLGDSHRIVPVGGCK